MKIYELIVEPEREEHVARHQVSLIEVEEVIFGKHASFRSQHGYYGLVGQTESGRYLTILYRLSRRRGIRSGDSQRR